MALLPFYVPRPEPVNVVLIGGGYAGLAALISLRRYAPTAHITVIDPNPAHIKITHLHETFRNRLSDFVVPFDKIAERFGCRHLQASIDVSESEVREWEENRGLVLQEEFLDFDYLVVATGTGGAALQKDEFVYDLGDFMRSEGSALMERIPKDGVLTVVGGGATGIQFVFEIAGFIRSRGLSLRLRLVDAEERLLKQFVPDLGRYVEMRMSEQGIDYLPRTFYRGHHAGKVALEGADDGRSLELDSCAAFLFPGKSPSLPLTTNIFGQVVVDGKPLNRVFAAGDCSQFRGVGSNTLTAQAAVRKGKLVARNILRHSGRLKILEPYLHRDMGYVISLGPADAVGWLALEGNVVGGYPALVVKELVEAQYDLLLAGIDTYLL